MRKVFSTTSLYRPTSSSSRHRGYVGDAAKAQPVNPLSYITQCWCTVGTVGALRIAQRLSPLPTSHAVFPTPLCELQCGQFLARHLHALLERPVAHHLALDLVHAVNHRGEGRAPDDARPDVQGARGDGAAGIVRDRKSTRLNSSH